MEIQKRRITIIGSGLTGSLLALMLGRKGFQVDVYERRPDIRLEGFKGGRSINLALSHRGLAALDQLGLREEILKLAIPMKGRRIHDIEGNLSFQPYGKDETEVINSISRAELNLYLLTLGIAEPAVNFYFEHNVLDYNSKSNILLIENAEGGKFTVSPQLLIGADGARSILRQEMLNRPMFNYSQEFLNYGYKELEIPPGDGEIFRIEPNFLHIWPRQSFLMIALPNTDGSFTCTLFAPYEGENGLQTLNTKEQVSAYFETYFPDAISHLVNLTDEFFSNPTGRLVTIKCEPWHIGDKAVLIGDAAHAIIPFYGQGMNAGFEDCKVLMELVENETTWDKVLQKFTNLRKKNTDAVAQLSYDNFIEMRDKVADKNFLERKAAELQLYEKYPKEIISKYSMVSFHPEIPYSVAKTKGEILEQTILEMFNSKKDTFDVEEAHSTILSKYEEI